MKTSLKKVIQFTSLAAALATGSVFAGSSTSAIKEAVADPARAKQSTRDEYRHPVETLKFFGLKEDMTVVEIWPGGGWYTSILNPVLKDKGQLIGAHFHMHDKAPRYYKRSLEGFNKKIANDALYEGIMVTEFHPTMALDVAPTGSADMVLTFRNLHNWYMADGDKGVENSFKAFYKALKKGGVLGVVDHRMPEHLNQEENKRSGYMKQSYTIKMAEKAGFKLVASSEINANKKDTAEHPRGVWTLPPRLALGDEDKAKYQAIGESDRMTLKFVKQ
jgi:predicted methyltransferase